MSEVKTCEVCGDEFICKGNEAFDDCWCRGFPGLVEGPTIKFKDCVCEHDLEVFLRSGPARIKETTDE